MESVRPAHFPEPLEPESCGEHNGLNYGVWTSHVGPGRQELTSPHLLHASDPRLGWEAWGLWSSFWITTTHRYLVGWQRETPREYGHGARAFSPRPGRAG